MTIFSLHRSPWAAWAAWADRRIATLRRICWSNALGSWNAPPWTCRRSWSVRVAMSLPRFKLWRCNVVRSMSRFSLRLGFLHDVCCSIQYMTHLKSLCYSLFIVIYIYIHTCIWYVWWYCRDITCNCRDHDDKDFSWDAKKDSNRGILTGNSRSSSTHVISFPNLDGLVLLGRVSPSAANSDCTGSVIAAQFSYSQWMEFNGISPVWQG